MLKISSSRITELFSVISNDMTLYLPIETDGLVNFSKWQPGSVVRLDKFNTSQPPKELFFPNTENIAAFKTHKKEILIEDMHSIAQVEPFAVFGVRACDAESLNLLDKVFLSDPVDTFYEVRRKNGIIITMACFQPEESCFCAAFNIDATNPRVGDIVTWFVDDNIYWKPITERGNKLTEKIMELSVSSKSLPAEVQNAKEIFSKLPFANLSLTAFTSNTLMGKFNSPKWEELCTTCLGCGTCTFICPTCHCYDIQDYDTGEKIVRHRCWDSCMYSDFTLMAHGNPRTSQLERFRQRFMHKLIYFPENNDGAYACTGCGRCVQKCPVAMNIIKVIKALEA